MSHGFQFPSYWRRRARRNEESDPSRSQQQSNNEGLAEDEDDDNIRQAVYGSLLPDAQPAPNTYYTRRAQTQTGEACLGVLTNLTQKIQPEAATAASSFSSSFLPSTEEGVSAIRASKTLLEPEILQLILPLIQFSDSELVCLKASQTVDHITRLEEGRTKLREAGAIAILHKTLESLAKKDRSNPITTSTSNSTSSDSGNNNDSSSKTINSGTTMDEMRCRAIISALRSIARDPEGFEDIKKLHHSHPQGSNSYSDDSSSSSLTSSSSAISFNSSIATNLTSSSSSRDSTSSATTADLLMEVLMNGSEMERALAASCLAPLFKSTDDQMAYECCSHRNALDHLIPMLLPSESELTHLCGCAAINRLATCPRARPYLAERRELVPLLIDLFEIEETPHKTHIHVHSLVLGTFVYLMECKDLHQQMVDERLIDMAIYMMMDQEAAEHEEKEEKEEEGDTGRRRRRKGAGSINKGTKKKGMRVIGFREKVQLSTVVFGLEAYHTEAQVEDWSETFMRALLHDDDSEEEIEKRKDKDSQKKGQKHKKKKKINNALCLSHAGHLFLHYLLQKVEHQPYLLEPLADLGLIVLLVQTWARKMGLSAVVRENALRILIVLTENYEANHDRFEGAGVIECACFYLLPSTDASDVMRTVALMLLKAMEVYYDERVGACLRSTQYQFIRQMMNKDIPHSEGYLNIVREARRNWIVYDVARKMDQGDLRWDEIEDMITVFIKHDLDYSANIDLVELRSVFRSLGIKLNWLQALAVLRAADRDGSGTIEIDEFVVLMTDWKNGKITGLGYIKDVLSEALTKTAAAMNQFLDGGDDEEEEEGGEGKGGDEEEGDEEGEDDEEDEEQEGGRRRQKKGVGRSFYDDDDGPDVKTRRGSLLSWADGLL